MTQLLKAVIPLAVVAAAHTQMLPAPLARLESNIQRVTKSVNADWGIYIKCLETGEEVALNADRPMETMSVIKIPLMVEAFRQIGEGKFALTVLVAPGEGAIVAAPEGAMAPLVDGSERARGCGISLAIESQSFSDKSRDADPKGLLTALAQAREKEARAAGGWSAINF